MKNRKHHFRSLCILFMTTATYCSIAETTPQALAQNATPNAQLPVDTLLHKFKTAKYFWQQNQAGEKLVALGDKSVVPQMLALLKSDSRKERCNAGRVLAGLGDDRGLFAVIVELSDTSYRPLQEGDLMGNGRSQAQQLTSDHYYAAHVLRQIGDRRAVPALIKALRDKTIDYQAAIVLGRLGDKSAIPALRDLLATTKEKLWPGYGLMWLGDPLGLETVLGALKTAQPWTNRRHAVSALAEFGDRRAVPALIEALHDEEINVRVSVIGALGKLGDKTAVPALQALLNDTTQSTTGPLTTIQDAVTQALQQIAAKNEPTAPVP